MSRVSYIVLLIILPISVLVSCSDQKHTPINIAGNHWLGYQPLFVAYEKALLGHQPGSDVPEALDQAVKRFRINMLPSTSSVMRAMSNQQLDGAMMTLDEAIQFQDKNKMDLCIAMVMDYSGGADALVINPKAKSMLGSHKVKIGYESTALGGFMLRRAIEKLAIDPALVNAIIVEANDHTTAYESGKVDAVITFEPYLQQVISKGGEVVFSSRQIENEIMDVLIVKRQVWNQHKENFRQLIDVIWQSGLDMLVARNFQTMEIIRGYSGLSNAEIIEGYDGIHLLTPEENRKLMEGNLSQFVSKMHAYLQSIDQVTGQTKLDACR